MLFPGEGFSFLCSSQGAYTFIFPVTLSLHIFFNPPADTSAHVPEAPHSLLCGHQSYRAQLQGLLLPRLIFHQKLSFHNWSTRSCTNKNCYMLKETSICHICLYIMTQIMVVALEGEYPNKGTHLVKCMHGTRAAISNQLVFNYLIKLPSILIIEQLV